MAVSGGFRWFQKGREWRAWEMGLFDFYYFKRLRFCQYLKKQPPVGIFNLAPFNFIFCLRLSKHLSSVEFHGMHVVQFREEKYSFPEIKENCT
jgi:hypothetical protein